MTKIYSARWVLPVTSGPFENGAVAVEGTRVAGVGARAQLAERFPSAEVLDLGEAAILPGLVNCHTHLELTAMRGFLEPEEGNFFAWLRKITVARRERMTHAAESRAEELLMLYGKGPFAEGFASRGFTFRSPGVSTVRHLAETGVLQARPLLAHCVRVDDEDIRLIKEHGASVAHCPKSNAKLG